MDKCYEGISIPTPIEAPCGNTYMSTSCVTTPSLIADLNLPAGTNQTEINSTIATALQYAFSQIKDLKDRIVILENQ